MECARVVTHPLSAGLLAALRALVKSTRKGDH
jgi:hypothetical protein